MLKWEMLILAEIEGNRYMHEFVLFPDKLYTPEKFLLCKNPQFISPHIITADLRIIAA